MRDDNDNNCGDDSDDGNSIVPWICHICGYKSDQIASRACDSCYKVACSTHLQRVMRKNPDNGLYEIAMICPECALEGVL